MRIYILDANSRPAPGPDTRRKIFLDFVDRTNGVIQYMPSNYITRVDYANKVVETQKGEKYSYTVLMAIGPTHAPDWLIASGLASRFVDVNRTTFKHTKHSDIYAAGDAIGFTNYGYAVGSARIAAEALATELGFAPSDPTTEISNENYNNLYDDYFVHIKLNIPKGGQEQGAAELVNGKLYENLRINWTIGTTSIYKQRI